jgi:hypothetical protein
VVRVKTVFEKTLSTGAAVYKKKLIRQPWIALIPGLGW